ANMTNGTATTTIGPMDRPQVNGSLTYFKDGWAGSHSFKVGGEFMKDLMWRTNPTPFGGLVLTLNNGVPSQVNVYLPSTKSELRLNTLSGYVQDGWKMSSRLTVTLGIRLDHYDSYAPAQTGVLGHQIDQIRGPLWNNLGPRLGIVYGVTSDQKTIIKAN